MTKFSISVNGIVETIFSDFVISYNLVISREYFSYARLNTKITYNMATFYPWKYVLLNSDISIICKFSYIKKKVANLIFEKCHLVKSEFKTIISF